MTVSIGSGCGHPIRNPIDFPSSAFRAYWPLATERLLLTALSRRNSCEGQQIHHLEVTRLLSEPIEQRRPPAGIRSQVRIAVELHQSDQHLADDPTADRAERIAARHHMRFAQDVEP